MVGSLGLFCCKGQMSSLSHRMQSRGYVFVFSISLRKGRGGWVSRIETPIQSQPPRGFPAPVLSFLPGITLSLSGFSPGILSRTDSLVVVVVMQGRAGSIASVAPALESKRPPVILAIHHTFERFQFPWEMCSACPHGDEMWDHVENVNLYPHLPG